MVISSLVLVSFTPSRVPRHRALPESWITSFRGPSEKGGERWNFLTTPARVLNCCPDGGNRPCFPQAKCRRLWEGSGAQPPHPRWGCGSYSFIVLTVQNRSARCTSLRVRSVGPRALSLRSRDSFCCGDHCAIPLSPVTQEAGCSEARGGVLAVPTSSRGCPPSSGGDSEYTG